MRAFKPASAPWLAKAPLKRNALVLRAWFTHEIGQLVSPVIDFWLDIVSLAALLTSVAVTLCLFMWTWRHRAARGALSLASLLAMMTAFTIVYFTSLLTHNLALRTVQDHLLATLATLMPPLWIVFLLEYARQARWLRAPWLALLWMPALILVGAYWTNPLHGLYWKGADVFEEGVFYHLDLQYGIVARFEQAYAIVLCTGSILVQSIVMARSGKGWSHPLRPMLLATLAPTVMNIMDTFNIHLVGHVSLTPISFAFAGCAMGGALLRHEVLNLIPAARAAVFENLEEGALVVNENGVVVDANPAVRRMIGLTGPAIVGISLSDVLKEWPQLQSHLADATPGVFEVSKKGPSNTARWYEVRVRELHDAHGWSEGRLLTLRDITERKKTEHSLRSRLTALTQPREDVADVEFAHLFDIPSIQRLQDAFASAFGVASVIVRDNGTQITEPSHFCRLCRSLVLSSDKGRQRCQQAHARLSAGSNRPATPGQWCAMGLMIERAPIMVGERQIACWLLGQVLPPDADLEAMSRQAQAIGVDPVEYRRALDEAPRMSVQQFERITESMHLLARQLSELALNNLQQARHIAERERVEEALRRSEASLVLSQRIGRVGSWHLDLENYHMRWSQEACRVFGYDPAACEPSMEAMLSVMHPEDRPAVEAAWKATIDDGAPFRVEYRIVLPDGALRMVLAQGQIVVEPRGVILFSGTVQDITEHRQLEEQLRQSQKMEAIGQLAGGVAHDFNNILTIIQGHAELLMGGGMDLEEQEESLRQIQQASERAANLTRQLLAYSRRQVLQKQPIDLSTVVAGMTPMIQRLLGETVTLSLKLSSGIPAVLADAGKMEQILMNLSINARDAMPRGGTLTVTIGSEWVNDAHLRRQPEARVGEFVRWSVADNGSGMDARTVQRIFEPFFTTKEFGKGTGLGLATVYGIVKQHDGWIEVESEVGKGAVFHIFLPSTRQKAGATFAQSHPPALPPATGTILLVEDEAPVRQLLLRMLANWGYHVYTASSGDEALPVWEQHQDEIDLLLTDLVMPGELSGRDLAQRLLAERPELKVLYSSGYCLEQTKEELGLNETVNFVQKPCQPQHLADTLRRLLATPSLPVQSMTE